MTDTIQRLRSLSNHMRDLIEDSDDDPYLSADDLGELRKMREALIEMRGRARDRKADDHA